jgi:hypothetical protein
MMSAILCDFERVHTTLNPTTSALRDGKTLLAAPVIAGIRRKQHQSKSGNFILIIS